MNSKYKYLLFDADNTLFDFNAAENRAFLALDSIDPFVFTKENYPLYHEINDLMWKRLEKCEISKSELKSLRFRELYRTLGVDVYDETISMIVATYPKMLALGTDLINGAEELIKNLSRDYEIYIITNGLSDVQTTRLSNSVLKPYIKDLFISEAVGAEKPSIRFFDHVLEVIGDSDRSRYIVIGDSLSSDIDGAIASGIDSVYFDPRSVGTKGRSVTYTVRELCEINEILA